MYCQLNKTLWLEVFDIGMYEYDNNFIFIPWEKAEKFLSTKQIAHGIEIFANPKTTHNVHSDLNTKLDKSFTIIDWKKEIHLL